MKPHPGQRSSEHWQLRYGFFEPFSDFTNLWFAKVVNAVHVCVFSKVVWKFLSL